jgi:hypothetical protein
MNGEPNFDRPLFFRSHEGPLDTKWFGIFGRPSCSIHRMKPLPSEHHNYGSAYLLTYC